MPPSLTARLVEGRRKFFWVACAAVVVLDQWTKHVSAGIEPGGQIVLVPSFLKLVTQHLNQQGAFSHGPNAPLFYVAAAVVGIALILYFSLTTHPDRLHAQIVLGAICGGAVGNMIDRIALGGVRDFIDLHWMDRAHWPAFNVADAALSIGVFLLLAEAFLPALWGRLKGRGEAAEPGGA